jgi:leader peptidase (prepilin peptidase)/N-methyltransferase
MLVPLTVTAIVGFVLGRIAAGWAASLLVGMNCGGLLNCPACLADVSVANRWFRLRPICCGCGKSKVTWHLASAVGLATISTVFAWLLLSPEIRCQAVHEVRPDAPLMYSRLPYHLALLFFLWVATLTDFLDYVIPDEVIYPGIAIAVLGAFFSGELQMIHIWVDWDEAAMSLYGPWLPEWIKHHQHLHGLAWSIAGLSAGASITWLVRWLSGRILGYPALGGGDVTLMALIGAFLGWQPTLCALALAPLTGIVIGIGTRLISGRNFVAFGPWLACSALVVISTWRWLWADYFSLRDIFGHWPTVVGLIGFAFACLIVLLVLLRLMRTLPASRLRR